MRTPKFKTLKDHETQKHVLYSNGQNELVDEENLRSSRGIGNTGDRSDSDTQEMDACRAPEVVTDGGPVATGESWPKGSESSGVAE